MQQQSRGVMDVTADDVFMGNGVSECIDLALRAMLNSGDEVLVPSPVIPCGAPRFRSITVRRFIIIVCLKTAFNRTRMRFAAC